jgi:hypothetical protein
LALDWSWVKAHIGIGEAVVVVFFFFVFAGILMPKIHSVLLLPSALISELIIYRLSKSRGDFVRGIKQHKLLEFAIIEGNGIAYQEYLRKLGVADKIIKDGCWTFVFLCSLCLDAFAAKGVAESLVEVLWSALQRLPSWAFYPAVMALGASLFILLLSSLIAFRFMDKYYPVGERLYQLIEASLSPDQGEYTEETGEIGET